MTALKKLIPRKKIQKNLQKIKKKKIIQRINSLKAEKSQFLSSEDKLVIKSLIDTSLNRERVQCMHREYNSQGEIVQCSSYAVPGSTLCKEHGGVVNKDLLLTDAEIVHQLNTKFNPVVHPIQYIQLSRTGHNLKMICAEIGVSATTIKNWSEKYLSMAHAVEIGDELYESWWLHEGMNNLTDNKYNTSLYKFMTMNLLGYSDKMESKSYNKSLCGVMLVPNRAETVDEWQTKVKKVQEAQAGDNHE